MKAQPDSSRHVKVWDLPLRLFHWALVLCVVGAIASAKLGDAISGAMDWHPRFGLAALTLLLFRLIWGFVGGTHARFRNFVRGPSTIVDYLKGASNKSGIIVGHNPLGALSVLAMIGAILFQTISGLFITDEIFVEGPLFKHVSSELAHTLAGLHKGNAKLIMALVALHLSALLFYRVVKRDKLVKPMITGCKEVPVDAGVQDSQGGGGLLGAIVLALAAAAVWYVATQV